MFRRQNLSRHILSRIKKTPKTLIPVPKPSPKTHIKSLGYQEYTHFGSINLKLKLAFFHCRIY